MLTRRAFRNEACQDAAIGERHEADRRFPAITRVGLCKQAQLGTAERASCSTSWDTLTRRMSSGVPRASSRTFDG